MIAAIENAIIAAVKAQEASGALGYELKTLRTYGGEFADGLDRAVPNFPAVMVLFGGGPVSKEGAALKVTARFLIICAASNIRNEAAGRQGDEVSGKVGSYQIMLDMIRLLSNQNFDLDIEAIRITNTRALINDRVNQKLASVYGVDIETSFSIDGLSDLTDVGIFETFHANWDVPEFGNVSTTLPADQTADATDHVTLPQ